MYLKNPLCRLVVFLGFVLISCQEVPVVLPILDNQPTGTAKQNVLIEEYTGVRCQNCPAGASALEDLKKIHGDRLVIVSIHGGFFAQPTNRENKFNLDNDFGKELIRIYNQPQGYPSAIINRKQFEGQPSLFLGGPTWAGYVQSEKEKTPTMDITLTITKNKESRTWSVDVTLVSLKAELNAISLSVLLVENNIKDAQLTLTGVDTGYVHQHVLRRFLTPVTGQRIEPLTVNASKLINFSTTIPLDWNQNELKVVALVHQSGNFMQLIQVVEK